MSDIKKKYCKFMRKYVSVMSDGGILTCLSEDNAPGGKCVSPSIPCYLVGMGGLSSPGSAFDNPFGDNPEYDPLPPI